MRRIGLIGGMSWESTATYYKCLNEKVRDTLGGLHSADIILHSVDFARIVELQTSGNWGRATELLVQLAIELEGAGAEILLICTNTMHIMADAVQAAVKIPLLHIADVTGAAARAGGAKRPLLLATRYTMEQPFYLERLRQKNGLAPLVPREIDRGAVHSIIFDELCKGVVREPSRHRYLEIIERGRAEGADSVILGCTEIGMLISQADVDLPVFDSTLLHAHAAIEYSLAEPTLRPLPQAVAYRDQI
ncbi:MAG: aspartate/glutamate racemase family protein [Proteobacteria bacterium]|nr:aspartate/glutamate racemase family protein [Pseudomonadota bacterium]